MFERSADFTKNTQLLRKELQRKKSEQSMLQTNAQSLMQSTLTSNSLTPSGDFDIRQQALPQNRLMHPQKSVPSHGQQRLVSVAKLLWEGDMMWKFPYNGKVHSSYLSTRRSFDNLPTFRVLRSDELFF